METVINVNFPGGKAVDATLGERSIRTDQNSPNGGGGDAPEPFQLVLASIATCAGFYALSFCEGRGLSTEGLGLTMSCRRHETEPRFDRMVIELTVPESFPEKYRAGVRRAMDLCAVKKHILNPPEFDVKVTNSP